MLIKNGTGDTIFSKAYGGKTIDSPIVAASINKNVYCCMYFTLIQQGYMTLNDSLLDFYEPAYLMGLHVYKGKDYSRELKISDLIYQTSGLADIYEEGKNNIKKQAIISDTFITFERNIALTKEKEMLIST